MLFNIKGIKVKISFTFFAVYLIFLGFSEEKLFFQSVGAALMHEAVHLILIIIFKSKIDEISFNGAGGTIKQSHAQALPDFKEALINLGAPLFNIISGTVLILFDNNNFFGQVNLFLGLFNLLPFYSFDGGRGLGCILRHFLSFRARNNIIIILSCIVAIIVGIIGVLIFKLNHNPFGIFISMFMIFSLVMNIYYDNMQL